MKQHRSRNALVICGVVALVGLVISGFALFLYFTGCSTLPTPPGCENSTCPPGPPPEHGLGCWDSTSLALGQFGGGLLLVGGVLSVALSVYRVRRVL
jgi:hypothetical protein